MNHCIAYIDSPNLRKNKKGTINAINKKDECFQYAITVMLNHENKRSTKTKIRPFIDKYNCEGMNFPSEKYHWKKFQENNVIVALNVFNANKENMYLDYVSKHNSNCEK